MQEIRGIIPILSTSFDESMRIDEEDMRHQVNYAIEQGAHGLAPNGGTSECFKLSVEERQRVTEWVMEEARGRVPVVVGVSAAGTVDSVRLARHANEKGAAGVLSMPLISGAPTPEAIYAHFKALNDAIDIPIMVQEQNIPGALVKRMADKLEHVRYIKEEHPKNLGQKITEILSLTDKVEVFSTGRNLIDELQRGAIGALPSCVGLARYVKIFNSYTQGDFETAWVEFERLSPLVTFRQQINAILVAKEVLRRNGVFKSIRTRNPVGTPLDEMEIKMLDQIIERMGPPF